jgi:hypothetical protein
MSAPSIGATGKIVSKGLDVSKRNDRKPTAIIEIIPRDFALSTSSYDTK